MEIFIKIISYPIALVYMLIRWFLGPFITKPSVNLTFSSDPYFVGSYQKIKVRLHKLTMDDLRFRIQEGAPGGYVSECRDAEYDSQNPDIMLCFGYQPGTYHLTVHKRSDNSLLKTVEFSIDTKWTDEKRGPGISFTGISENIIA